MECVKTPRFTLMINGDTEGFFPAKRGLRLGDPMSSLLFALSMDYLLRIMAYFSEMEVFKHFIGCKTMKLNHLRFADDLMLFCEGDPSSAYLLLQV